MSRKLPWIVWRRVDAPGRPWYRVANYTTKERAEAAIPAFVKDDPQDFGTDGYGTLYIEFQGGHIYAYQDMSYEDHSALLDAESVGGYLNAIIKPNYDCERILLN